ncbi:AAA+ family ATPase [Tabrizicola sp.]|uniref:AAA+ family ATPase n=1 Tax=Tabrizicola sp. TaxID=2005166 RepID=UPI003F374F7C
MILCVAAMPAFAQEVPAVPKAEDDGFSLMEEGMKLVMRGMMTEMEPALNEMEKALTEMKPKWDELGPKFQELIAMIDDFRNYDAPVMLPNGDILIRRNAPLVPKPEFAPGPNGEIEL